MGCGSCRKNQMMKSPTPLHARYEQIERAYTAELNGRDPNLVSIFDLLPAIYAAVPDTNTEEIAEALRWSGKSFRDFTSSWRMITAPSRREHDETP